MKKKLDFSNVEKLVKCTEGQHIVKLIEASEGESEAGNAKIDAVFQVVKGNCKGAKLYDNFTLTEKALWKLQEYLEAIGINATGKVVIDTDKYIGKICIADVKHEEYNGKVRAKIQEFIKLEASKKDEPDDDEDIDEDEDEDIEEADEEEEKPSKSKGNKKKEEPKKASKVDKKKSSKKPQPKDEDEDDDEDWDED